MTKLSGSNVVGFPPVTDILGTICNIQMSKKYSRYKIIVTIWNVTKLMNNVQRNESESCGRR